MTTTALLVACVDEAYDKRAWHGTNLRGSLRGVTVAQAAVRARPDGHNIWELMVHAAYRDPFAHLSLTVLEDRGTASVVAAMKEGEVGEARSGRR